MSHKLIKIGRSQDNDVVLTHPSISRQHAELFSDPMGNVFLTDLDSANGTFVNGRRISGSVQLQPSDLVKLGVGDVIPWRNYLKNTDSYTPPTDDDDFVEIGGKKPVKKKSGNGIWKTITITLSVLFGIVLIGYALNESSVFDSKPEAIDPNKPNNEDPQPEKDERRNGKEILYDFSCLGDEKDMGSTDIINILEGVDSEVTDALGGEVTIEEEEKLGAQLHEDCKQKYQFIEEGIKIENLEILLTRLVEQIKKPKGYHYKIYLIKDDKRLNAFTAGARIYVTTRMYEFCKSNDELACVIGHEINHNELGHIKQHIQKARLLTNVGAGIAGLATISFGQKKETHCDLTGIDLAISAGYNGCVNIELWKRMQQESQEGEYNPVDNLFRSHPYSEKRAKCSHQHILNNYGFDCETKQIVQDGD
jgi:pSer/pThr/pTyr-binding forkhead associated (FHA) protein